MTTHRRNVSDGPAGIAEILATLSALKDHYGSLPAIRAAALRIAGNTTDNDERHHADRLARFVRRSVVYVADPLNSEFIQTPDVMLLAISDTGHTFGDCDDHVLLFCALAESVGLACDVAGVEAPGTSGAVNHVIAVVRFGDGSTDQFDLCAKSGPAPFYSSLVIVPA